MKKYFNYSLWVLFLIQFGIAGCDKKDADTEPAPPMVFTGILKNIQTAHPRLLLSKERLDELKTLSLTDSRLKKYASDVIAQADKDIFKQPLQHVLIGPRLLDISRECLLRVYNLAFAYRWTGNPKYLSSAVANLRNVCSFSDWNPSHFLDVAEMTHAVAIGYDWLYDDMDETERKAIKDGLIKLGLNEGKKAYAANAWWMKVDHNWNQVCNSGLLIGALAIAETDSALAAGILRNAIENLPFALNSYGPDGVWGEGPGYWSYATDYTAYGISALQSALGNDFGLTKYPGMSLTGYFPMYSAGPSDLMLNYADAGEKSKLTAPHTEMWLAGVYNNNHFSDFLIERLQTRTANVRNVIWYRPYSNISMHRDLDKFFGGKVALFFSRSSWTDANALWVGIKAGYNKVNHAHLDLGNFELDALGQRWVRDLGSDDYNLPGYFSGSTQTSQRWTYYRINSFSHNVPVLNGKNQDISATSQIVKHAVGVAEPFTIIDFTEAYKEFATSALRGLKVVNERKAVLIQDEFEIAKASSISWGITTDATILIVKDKEAELTLNGKKLIVKILSPANAVFSSESAQQAAPQKANTGVSRLLAKMPEQTGNITITILLEPQWTGGLSGYSSAMVSLSNW